MKAWLFNWAAKTILSNSGAAGLPPAKADLENEFEPAAFDTYMSLSADFGTDLFVEARKDAAQRHDSALKIHTGDLMAALPRVIFRRAYQRRASGIILKVFIALFGFLGGFTINKAAAESPAPEWFVWSALLIAGSILFLVVDHNRETKP